MIFNQTPLLLDILNQKSVFAETIIPKYESTTHFTN
jgi:hypothetical protein